MQQIQHLQENDGNECAWHEEDVYMQYDGQGVGAYREIAMSYAASFLVEIATAERLS